VLTAFKKMQKGALMGLYVGAFALAQLHEMEIAKQARDVQSKQGKKLLRMKEGVLLQWLKHAKQCNLARMTRLRRIIAF